MVRSQHAPLMSLLTKLQIICPTAAYSTQSYEHPSAVSSEYVKLKSKLIFWLINFVSFNPLDVKIGRYYLALQIDEYCIFGYEIVIKARHRRKNLEIGCLILKS